MVTFENMTLGQYQALYSIQKTDLDELDKVTESVAILTGKTNREVEDMPVTEYKRVVNELAGIWQKVQLQTEAVKKQIPANGRTYGITFVPANLTAGQYIELQKWMQGDVFENAHLILASISYPIIGGKDGKNDPSMHQQVSADFQEAAFKDVYPSILFFCQLFDASIRGLENYLAREIQKRRISKVEKQLMLTSLRTTMAGYTRLNSSQTITGSD